MSKNRNSDLSNRMKTTYNGDKFEKSVFEEFLAGLKKENYILEAEDKFVGKSKNVFAFIKKKEETLGIICTQGSLFNYLNSTTSGINKKDKTIPTKKVQEVWTKDLRPDIVIFNLKTNKVGVFEVKYQVKSGSVDEKLQTAVYKRELGKKLFKSYKITVEYEYILGTGKFGGQQAKNKISKPDRYADTFDFLSKNKIEYGVNKNETGFKSDLGINIQKYMNQ